MLLNNHLTHRAYQENLKKKKKQKIINVVRVFVCHNKVSLKALQCETE